MNYPTKFIKTPSYKLAYIESGNPKSDKLAIVLPGRLDPKDYVHMISHMEFLASRGFYAISIDPPFSWESPGDIQNYTTTNYLKAVNELLDHFDRPTLLIGHSRGGAVSILASGNSHVKAVAPIMATYGAASSPSQAAIDAGVYTTYRDLPPGDKKTAERKFTLPLTYFADSENIVLRRS